MDAEQLQKLRNYKEMNQFAKRKQILFTGSSLMEMFPVCEYEQSLGTGRVIYNRGIGGTTTDDFLENINTVLLDLEPSKVFINIGTNDIGPREDGIFWQEYLLHNYEKILKVIQAKLPDTKVYMMAYYPVNPDAPNVSEWAEKTMEIRNNQAISDTNEKLQRLAEKYHYFYIDVNDGIKDEQGRLRAEITLDGVHMYAGGYRTIYENLKKYLES